MCIWPCGALGTPVKEMGDTHSTGYKVPQEMGTQPLWLRNQG